MTDKEVEHQRMRNSMRLITRALEACTSTSPDADQELGFLLGGAHAKSIVLAILEFPAQTQAAVRRRAPLGLPFGGPEYLLYELVSDRSRMGLIRVGNLLAAGWNPNYTLPGTGRTALMQVVNNWTPENRNLVSLLLAAGADTTKPSASGMTVFDDAPTVMREFIRSSLADLKQDPTGRKCA